jgi:hypothetical protein
MGAVLAGGVKPMRSPPSAGVTDVRFGAPGGPEGVIVGDEAEKGPFPMSLTAWTWKTYPVPSVSPVIVAAVAVEPVSTLVQVAPPFEEYWTT